jgi:branched-chain amino acid transport system ATP-binding protein
MLDEPGAGLNAVELDQFKGLIESLNSDGLTVIVIEHVLALLFGISHRLMVMDSGEKVAEGPPELVARDDAVIEAYLGERGKEAFRALER